MDNYCIMLCVGVGVERYMIPVGIALEWVLKEHASMLLIDLYMKLGKTNFPIEIPVNRIYHLSCIIQ